MNNKFSKCVLVPVLVLAMTVTMILSSAFVTEPAYAGTERSTTYGNSGGDSYNDWNYGDNLAGSDIEESSKTISNKVTVVLDENEQNYADDGYLSYIASAHFGANGSRTVEPLLRTRCYDSSGNVLSTGNYENSTSTYWVAHAGYDYSSGNVTIPAGTKKIEYYVEVHIGTKGSLELQDMIFTINNEASGTEYKPISDNISDIQIYQSYDDNGKGIGNPVTNYYDLFKNSYIRLDISEDELLYKAAVSNEENLSRWSQLAYNIYRGNDDTYWDWNGGGFDNDFGKGAYMDLIADLSGKVSRENDSNITTKSTGICMANSFDGAIYKMLENQAGLRNRNAEAEDFLDRHTDMSLGSDEEDSKKQTVYYTSVSTSDAYGGTYKYGYNTMGIIFYDFCIVPLIDEEPYVTENQSGGTPETKTSISYCDNNSRENDTTFAKQIGTVSGSDTTNTITNSQGVTKTHTVGGDVSFGVKYGLNENTGINVNFSLAYNFSAAEMFESGESESVSHSESYSDTTSSSVTVPPKTRANIVSESDTVAFSMKYDCPVGISYKTAIVSMCGSYYDDDAAILDMTSVDYNHRTFITVFGNDEDGTNAVKNLKDRVDNRTIDGYESSHGYTLLTSMDDGLLADELWISKVYSYGEPCRESGNTYQPTLYTVKELTEYMGYNEPMSVTGASINSVADSTDISVGDYEPLSPLKNVLVTNIKVQLRENTISVPVGGEYYLIDITVDGFDKDNVPYYGFQSTWGTWEIIDDNTGKAVDKSIAEVVTSNTTGKAILKVYQEYDGLVLKYNIPENKYKAVGQESYTKNSDLDNTAYVYVEVKGSNVKKDTYSDVNDTDWYKDGVKFVSDRNIMEGVGNELFAPDSEFTRAMMAVVVWKMSGSEEPIGKNPFKDLDKDWYKKAVVWAAENGITNGVSEDCFSPNSKITREQFAVFLYRIAKLEAGVIDQPEGTAVITPATLKFDKSKVSLSKFKDKELISDFALDAIKWAVDNEIITGNTDGTLNPKGTATRAEIAVMLARYIN